LDPFCGCGTAVVAAHKLNRRWIGIDITHLAITVMKERLRDSFPGVEFEVVGEPADVASARALAEQDRYQFQWWALSLVNAKPVGDDKKKGADRGIDGLIGFVEAGGKGKRVVVQVKSGHVNAGHIRDLKGTMEREKAELGLFITLEEPTQPMKTEAVSAGFYHSELWDEDYPRIQICTIEELLAGKQPKLPRWASPGFPKAPKIARKEGEQAEML
ncbi:MAG: restriction endonuclease, partial [Dehalococcoidia bacterium]